MYWDESGNIAIADDIVIIAAAALYGVVTYFFASTVVAPGGIDVDLPDIELPSMSDIFDSIIGQVKKLATTISKSISVTLPPDPPKPTYYHATTPENAALIIATGIMKGSAAEYGHVFAWKRLPSKEAVQLSGARGGVAIIKFETSAAFEKDNGIDDIKISETYYPVVTVVARPIKVDNVVIVKMYH